MQTRVIDLNCKEKDYLFNISIVTDNEWKSFAQTIVFNSGHCAGSLQINGYKVVIRDNKAKLKIFYQDKAYHELEYHIDVLGRASRNYQDDVSVLWQDLMEAHYGAEYAHYVQTSLNKNQTKSV